jgi:hypothetical protein
VSLFEKRGQVTSVKHPARRSLAAEKAERRIVCSGQTKAIQNRSTDQQSRLWKIIEGE